MLLLLSVVGSWPDEICVQYSWSEELHFLNTPEFRLFDMRTDHQLQVYQQPGGSDVPTVTSTAFLSSGRLLFADIPMGIASYGILY
ncbi:hypothetical protein C5167_050402 [Papaver somniferum]|uniref:Uncharacterized protein n=1 Tax=Papaver somniferum TaxID=3469 RepID=A0A4Y7KST6_PAPSO|nr:hypothetical protein C5167_050402 [Papaver somniferum]